MKQISCAGCVLAQMLCFSRYNRCCLLSHTVSSSPAKIVGTPEATSTSGESWIFPLFKDASQIRCPGRESLQMGKSRVSLLAEAHPTWDTERCYLLGESSGGRFLGSPLQKQASRQVLPQLQRPNPACRKNGNSRSPCSGLPGLPVLFHQVEDKHPPQQSHTNLYHLLWRQI